MVGGVFGVGLCLLRVQQKARSNVRAFDFNQALNC